MIAILSGILVRKTPTEVTIDVHGVGYSVSIPLSTSEKLGEIGSGVSLYTHLHVREDALQLYGFASTGEREMFRTLISVSGIGPRMAQGILSGASVTDLSSYITTGNSGALTSVPGIGKKLAERLVVELRDKVRMMDGRTGQPRESDDRAEGVRGEAILALTSLGYSRGSAEKAVGAAVASFSGTDMSIEAIIKAALRKAGA